MSEIILPLSTIALLILFNGIFIAAEFAIISVRPHLLATYIEQGNPTASKIKETLDDPVQLNRYITIAQLGMTIASLLLGMYGQHTMATKVVDPLIDQFNWNQSLTYIVTFIVSVTILTWVHVVIGDIIPKSLALHHAEGTILRFQPFINVMRILLFPFLIIISLLGDLLLRMLHIPQIRSTRRLYSTEELEQVVTESHKGGLLSDEEQEIIQNIFDLSERRVGQIMTPRPRIEAISFDISQHDLQHLIATSTYSRFPVYDGDLDHIVGLLLAKDFVRQQLEQPDHFDIKGLLRHLPAVPEAMTVDRLLAAFKRSHVHMALVFDEYGGTAGVVTLKDMVAEVVGEVYDEFDSIEQPYLQKIDSGIFVARGDLILDDLIEAAPGILRHNEEEPLPDVDTVSGLIVSSLGRPAQAGDRVEIQHTIFTVESVSGFVVNTVHIEYHPPDETQEDGNERVEV